MTRFVQSISLLCAIQFLAPVQVWAVTIDWSPVGNAGNPSDPADGDSGTAGVQHFGAVPYAYNIGTKDVSVSQYVEFLNAKDASGSNSLGLYNAAMSNSFGGINFTAGNLPGSKYSVISGRGDHPASQINWFDAIRFANWLNNGQGNGDTETGSYTLGALGAGGVPIDADSITRNEGAIIFLPTEDEWYKAAFYDPHTSSYFQYPSNSDTAATASGPPGTPNSANYNNAVGNLTDVGAYSSTVSPYGAFDMGGNVRQWNETLLLSSGFGFRGLRGSSYKASSLNLLSSDRIEINPLHTAVGDVGFGFRVAEIPEPSTLALAALGLITIATWLRR